MNRTTRTAAALAALLAAGTLAAGCGGDDDEPAAATTATTTTEPTTTEAPPATTEDEPETTTEQATTAEPEPEAREFEIEIRGGQPVGGIQRPSVKQGEQVVLIVTADAADEVHLHGYDLEAPIGPGRAGRIAFTAEVPGRFELELHSAGRQIAELTVEP